MEKTDFDFLAADESLISTATPARTILAGYLLTSGLEESTVRTYLHSCHGSNLVNKPAFERRDQRMPQNMFQLSIALEVLCIHADTEMRGQLETEQPDHPALPEFQKRFDRLSKIGGILPQRGLHTPHYTITTKEWRPE